MATEILATGSTAADSADVVVAAGTPVTVGLKGVADGQARVLISLYDGAAYNVVGELRSHSSSTQITAPGTYRFSRVAGATCGVYSG
jgi:hypothetical protein